MRLLFIALVSLVLVACYAPVQHETGFLVIDETGETYVGPPGSAFTYEADAVPAPPEGEPLAPEARIRVRVARPTTTE